MMVLVATVGLSLHATTVSLSLSLRVSYDVNIVYSVCLSPYNLCLTLTVSYDGTSVYCGPVSPCNHCLSHSVSVMMVLLSTVGLSLRPTTVSHAPCLLRWY
jgi:hypothetical protein